MMDLQENLDEILIETGKIKLDKLKEAWEIQRRTEKSLEEILLEMRCVTKDDINQAKAQSMGVEYVQLKELGSPDREILKSIPKSLILKHSVFPVEIRGKALALAMTDPKNIFILDDIRIATSREVLPVYADPLEIGKLIEKHYVEKEPVVREIGDLLGESENGNPAGRPEASRKHAKGGRDAEGENPAINNKNKISGILVEEGVITREQLEKALALQKDKGGLLDEILIKEGMVEKEVFYSVLARQKGIGYVDLKSAKISDETLELVNDSLAARLLAVPVEKEGITLKVAMHDPSNIFAIDDLRLATGLEIIPLLADKEDISAFLDKKKAREKKADHHRSKASKDGSGKPLDFDEEMKRVNEEIEIEIKDDQSEDSLNISDVQNAPIVKMVNLIFNKAVQNKSSDIHIEPTEEFTVVRNRIDGQLVEVMRHDRKIHQALVARIKIVSGLNIAERRLPQDGRISMKLDSRDYDMRVSILPAIFGEKVVIRLADKEGFNVKKQELGFFDDDLAKFDNILRNPHGIVLVTGPTGSGKSTTLYTALKELSKPNINILTVEDPVESTINGINQVQVNTKAGLTFAMALRAFLRQDPDIIMVGEIRDSETAEIAIRAAITGHLVLSTLHTNDAASSITRIIDMGVEPYLISSCIVGVIAQRLVRKLCPQCREEYEAPESERALLKIPAEEGGRLYRAKGCPACGNIGYKGRTAVYEIMTMNGELIEMIARNTHSNLLKEGAVRFGMKTLKDNCSRLVREGLTSIDELFRVAFTQEDK